MLPYGAIKQLDGTYAIVGRVNGTRRTSTYHIRDKISRCGGFWNGRLKQWEGVQERYLKELMAAKLMRVRIAACCHELEKITVVFSDEIVDGEVRISCGLCDTPYSAGLRAKVIQIIGEAV